MPTCKALRRLFFLGALSLASPVLAFNPTAEVSTPADAFWFGYSAYQKGDFVTAMDAIAYAAGQGYTRAQWLLAHMYANGDGVPQDATRAFQIFTEMADDHGYDNPRSDDAPFVADALVALGDYYRTGIAVGRTDFESARQLYLHAATYFGDDDAQYNLAWMFYAGEIGAADPVQAVRWARLAAENGNAAAQALLGHLLFEGEGISRQPVLGLAYLTIALEGGAKDDELRRMHEEAWLMATEAERRTAQALAQGWLAAAGPGPAAAAAPPVAAAAPEHASR